MDVIPLIVGLLLLAISLLGTVGGAVLYFRAENQSLKREIDRLRSEVADGRMSDSKLVQVQLDAINTSVKRIERNLADVAHSVNARRRASDYVSAE